MQRQKIEYIVPNSGKTLFIDFEPNGISIGFEGGGLCEEEKGFPIFVEFREGNAPILHVWADIECLDPTFTTGLQGALESARRVDEDKSCP